MSGPHLSLQSYLKSLIPTWSMWASLIFHDHNPPQGLCTDHFLFHETLSLLLNSPPSDLSWITISLRKLFLIPSPIDISPRVSVTPTFCLLITKIQSRARTLFCSLFSLQLLPQCVAHYRHAVNTYAKQTRKSFLFCDNIEDHFGQGD